MALKKDTVLAWNTVFTHKNEQTLAVMTFSKARLKDLQTRLQQVYTRKVKGNRLEKLNVSDLEASNAAFAREYTANLFRISGLQALLIAFPSSGNRSEEWAWKQMADWLKDRNAGCDFELVFDPAIIRHAKISSWMKKNQIHGSLVRQDLDLSLPLQTINLLAAWMNGSFEGELAEAADKIRMEFGMANGFEQKEARTFLLEGLHAKERKAARKAIDRCPELYDQGILDRWTKKELPSGLFACLNELMDLEIDHEQLLSLSPNRILVEAENLKKQAKQKNRKPHEQISQLSSLFTALIHQLCQSDKPDQTWMETRLNTLMENWIKNPEDQSQPNSCWIVLESEKDDSNLLLVHTPFLPLSLAKGQWADTPEVFRLDLEDLISFLEERSCNAPLQSLYLPENLYPKAYSWLIRTNRYLPVHPMDREMEEKISQLMQTLPSSSDLPLWQNQGSFEFSAPIQTLFSSEDFCDLSQSELDAFATHPLKLWQARSLCKAFRKGLSLARVKNVSDERSLDLLLASILISSSKQKFLASVSGDLSLYLSRKLSLPKMEAIEALVQNGLDPLWLQANLKGNITLVEIEQLGHQYPLGKLPYSWRRVVLLPEEIRQWMLEDAALQNPKMDLVSLTNSLMAFEQELFELLLAREN